MSQPSEIRPSSSTLPETQPEYDQQERQQLLHLAHASILSALGAAALPRIEPSPRLSETRGAFTTLYLRGILRGCVGYPTAVLALYRTVIETARAAAFEDPRFPPVSLEDACDLKVSLSILSPLSQISPEHVEVGRHGLVIGLDGCRGLLLPQVPVEHGWDRITFLEQTCRKAGLPLNSWREGATIEGFTAEVFGDDDVTG